MMPNKNGKNEDIILLLSGWLLEGLDLAYFIHGNQNDCALVL